MKLVFTGDYVVRLETTLVVIHCKSIDGILLILIEQFQVKTNRIGKSFLCVLWTIDWTLNLSYKFH